MTEKAGSSDCSNKASSRKLRRPENKRKEIVREFEFSSAQCMKK